MTLKHVHDPPISPVDMPTDEILELGLRRKRAGLTVLPAFIDRVLEILGDAAPDCEPREKEQFRLELAAYRQQIAEATENRDLAGVTSACVATCERYFRRSRQYYNDREAELTEVVGVLREAAALLVRQSSDFNTQVLSSAEAFGTLADLEDLRELRRQLTAEVSTLKQAVTDKERQDQETYPQLTSRVESLQMRLSQAEEQAALDPLTHVANRRAFDRTLRTMLQHAKANGTPLTLSLIDIDDFKSINDGRGHPIGDRVLLGTAQWLRRQIRTTDFVARYGGDEFAVLFPGMKAGQARARLESVLKEMADRHYEYEDESGKQAVSWTTSCGVASFDPHDTEEAFLLRADQALYDAKRKGKNRIVAKTGSLLGGLLSR